MSRIRAMRSELRAIFAAGAACALVFSLLVSGAAIGARRPATSAGAGGYTTIACLHDRDGSSSSFGTASSKPSGGQTEHIHCPDCCLATQAGSAVLPERLATIARPAPAAEHASYTVFASHEPIAAVSNTANGARAPPALSSLS